MDVQKLYPQYSTFKAFQSDRRQDKAPIAVDRRSGVDRRQYRLDDKLQADLTKIKGGVIVFARLIPPLRKLISAYETSTLNKDNKKDGHANLVYSGGMIFRFLNVFILLTKVNNVRMAGYTRNSH